MAKQIKNTVNGQFGRVFLNGVELFQVVNFKSELKMDLEELRNNNSWQVGYKVKQVSLEGSFKVKYVDSMALKSFVQMIKKHQIPTFKIQSNLEDPEQFEGQIESIYIGEAWLEGLTIMDWEMGKMVEKEFKFKANPESLNVLKEIADTNGIKLN